MSVPKLVTEADYKTLARSLERQYAASGMGEIAGDLPPVGSLSTAEQDAIRTVGDLIFQFGKTFDLSNDEVLSELSKFVSYLAQTRLTQAHSHAPVLAALLAVRDHYTMTGSQTGAIN